MSADFEATRVLREYDNQAEALTDQAALSQAGIQAVLSGDAPEGATFSGIEHAQAAPLQLLVPASQYGAALDILMQLEQPEEGWEEHAEEAIEGWLCLNCDTVMPEEELACSQCGTLRSEQPPEDGEDAEDDED